MSTQPSLRTITTRRTATGLLPVAAAVWVALGSASPGAVVSFPAQNIPIPNTFAGVSIDLEDGASSTALAGLAGGDANFFLGGAGVSNDASLSATSSSWQPLRSGTSNTDPIKNLGLNSVVDGNSDFYSSGFGGSGNPNVHFGDPISELFESGTAGYLGFSLVIDDPLDPGTDKTVYGWMRVRLQDNDGVGVVEEWAYEDSGAQILVGIPEPRSWVLAATGSAALLLLGRSRRAWPKK